MDCVSPYAHDHDLALTGWVCPVQGGPVRHELDLDTLKTDFEARMVISVELNPGRKEIKIVFLER